MRTLKGMTWSHERGVKPLVEAAKVFKEKYDVDIQWDARSLSDFELFPLDQLANEYDMIMIDHPHIGIAHKQNLLMPLEEHFSAEFFQNQKDGTVGKSYESYTYGGHQYAIPLDAAAQVCAYRKEMLDAIEETMPTTWEEVFTLAEKLPVDKKIAIPFVPVHAYSSFFTVCSQISKDVLFWSNEEDLDIEVGVKALELLTKVLAVAHPESANMDPINMLDKMNQEDEIIYSPLVYGYSNYSRDGYGTHVVRFGNMPILEEQPRGSMIGGVGLSISSKCKDVEAAIQFANMVSVPEYQKTTMFDDGGQPGHIDAWTDSYVNENCYDFFGATLETLQCGSLRPRFAGYIDFQAEAGARIRKFVTDGTGDKVAFVKELNALIRKCRENGGLS